MKYGFLLALMLFIGALYAQSDETSVQDSTGSYTLPVESSYEYDLQAFQSMMSGHYANALKEYETALRLNSSDSDARKGILWANNSLYRWKDTIKMGTGFLREFGYDADIDLYLAYAYFARKDYLHARQCYLWSSEYLSWFPANISGMAWTFRMLGDSSRERMFQRKWENFPDSLKAIAAPPPSPLYLGHIQIAYASWDDQEHSLMHHYTMHYQNLSVTSGVEDIWQKKDHLRTDYLASVNWDTPVSNIEWRGNWLKGDYSNLYPAYSHLVSINKPFYAFKTQLIPEMNAAYSYYPVLSVSQIELKQSYVRDSWWFSYSHAILYKDYDTPGMDTWKNWATWDIGTRIFTNFSVDLFTSHGDQTFYVSRAIGVVDNYVSGKLQYGVFVQYKYRILNLGLSYSLSKQADEDYSSTASFTMGVDYSPAKSH